MSRRETDIAKFIKLDNIESGRYIIFSFGKVFDLKRFEVRKPVNNGFGYFAVNLYDINLGRCRREYIHRLVAKHFIPREDGREYVNHIDGNKLNNSKENLEWVTAKENTVHGVKLGSVNGRSRVGVKTTHHPKSSLSESVKLLCKGLSLKVIADRINSKRGTVTTWFNGGSRVSEMLEAIEKNSCGGCRCQDYYQKIKGSEERIGSGEAL